MNLKNKKMIITYLHDGTVDSQISASLNVVYADFKGLSPINIKDTPNAKLSDFLDTELFNTEYYESDYRLREVWNSICAEITEWFKEDIASDCAISINDPMFNSQFFKDTVSSFYKTYEDKLLKTVITEELLHDNGIAYIREFVKQPVDFALTLSTENGIMQYSHNNINELNTLLTEIESGIICKHFFITAFFRVMVRLPANQKIFRVTGLKFNHNNMLISKIEKSDLQNMYDTNSKIFDVHENNIYMDVVDFFSVLQIDCNFYS